ncbi:MAG: UPF0149 family protein [Planctomycetota bacterium]|nr:UPF0149 family protein [Planctomycetota bacterium]
MKKSEVEQGLSEEEQVRLKSFIHSCPDAMDFHGALGLLTGVCSAPSTLMPSQWLPVMLGEVIYDSMEEAQEINGLIMRLYNQVNQSLNDKAHKLPAASLDEEQLGDWCHGYLEASRLDGTWGNDEAALNHLLPFGVLSGMFELEGETDDQGNIIEDDSAHRSRYSKTLPALVAKIHDYWTRWRRDQMSRSSPSQPQLQKIGRNEPCPCGSGQKYKKCCGR